MSIAQCQRLSSRVEQCQSPVSIVMWFSAVLVVVVGCVTSRVICVVDVKDNDILSGESPQDLVTRTKKSPDVIFNAKKSWGKEDKKRTWNDSPNLEEESGGLQESGKSDSETSAEMTSILAEDIKERLENLKDLEDSYIKLKSDLSNKDSLNNKRKSEIKSLLESKISEGRNLDDEDSLRIARQYNQDGQHYQQFYGERVMNADNTYSNKGRYQDSTHSSMNIYGDTGDPYLAQDYPYVRTYGAAGIEGYGREKEKTEHQSPLKPLKQLKQIIPNVINALAEITTPAKPVQSGGYSEKPGHHHPVKKPEHGIHKPTSYHKPSKHEKKPIGIEPIFYSKQIIFGIGTDKKLNTKNYYGTAVPELHSYPAQSYYPNGYSYYSPASYWAPLRDDYPTTANLSPEGNVYYPAVYSFDPEAQTGYDPKLTPYPQGNAYIEPLNSQLKTYYPIESPYLWNEAIPIQQNDANSAQDLSQSPLLMESSPTNLKNRNIQIESEIQKVKKKIEAIKEDLGDILKKTSFNDNKIPVLSETVQTNPTVNKRQAYDEESGGNNKVSNRVIGKFNEISKTFYFQGMNS